MNELLETQNQTPIEIALGIDENGMTTARKLYDFLELGAGQFARWAKTNIENNEFYKEGTDWVGFDIVSNGNKCKDYKLTTDFAKHLSMESHSAKGKIARQYFVTVEDKAKTIATSRQQLSPQMKMLYGMLDQMAQAERQANEAKMIADTAKETASKAIESVENIKEAVKPVFDNWREEINSKFNRIQRNADKQFNVLRTEMYLELERRAGCALGTRLRNMKDRMTEKGCKKSDIDKLNKMDVIEQDKKLREIFTKIVSEYEIKYCA